MTVCVRHQRMRSNTVNREICLCTIRQVKVISPSMNKVIVQRISEIIFSTYLHGKVDEKQDCSFSPLSLIDT